MLPSTYSVIYSEKICSLFGQIWIMYLKCSRASFSLSSYSKKMRWRRGWVIRFQPINFYMLISTFYLYLYRFSLYLHHLHQRCTENYVKRLRLSFSKNNGFQPFTLLAKSSISDIWTSSKWDKVFKNGASELMEDSL